MIKARASGSKVYLYFMKKGRQARHRIPRNSCVRSYDLFFCSETWQTAKDSYEISVYKCFDVQRPSSLRVRKSSRGHGGICLFIRNEILEGINILEQNSDGFFG